MMPVDAHPVDVVSAEANSVDAQRNDLFSVKDVEGRLGALLDDLVLRTSRTRLSVSRSDIEALQLAQRRAAELVATSFDMMIDQAEQRRSNLIRFAGLQVISVGEDCFSRTLATHWGMKPSARMDEKSHPFDLAVHPAATARQLIETDFTGYMVPANLEFLEREQIVLDRALRISFNHEIGEKFAADGFALLRATYQRRLENYFADIEASDRLLFLFHNQNPVTQNAAEVLRLAQAIATRWGGKDHRFVCINTWPHGAAVTPTDVIPATDSPTAPPPLVIDVPYPFPGYVWHLPAHCFSPRGYAFEREIVRRIASGLGDWIDARTAALQDAAA